MNRVFIKSDRLKELVYDARLRIDEWKVLFAVNGELDSQGIASFLEMPETEVAATLEKLQDMQFVSASENNGELNAEDAVAEVITFPGGADETEYAPEVEEEIEEAADTGVSTGLADYPVESKFEEEIAEEAELDEEENIFALEDEENEIELKNILSDTAEIEEDEDIEIAPEEAEEETSDEDLDKLIGNLLQEETPDYPQTAQPAGKTDFVETVSPEPETEEDFNLGNFFQKEAEEDITESESDIDTSIDDIFGSLEEETATLETPAPPVEKAPAKISAAPGTILVVDDSVVIRKMVEIALENESYNIASVATGKDALNYLDDHTPDLIILDIMLSDVNGLDVLKAIKASKDIPVVMLSAKDTPRETTKAKQLGADDFIPKPFKDEELVGKIKELINK